MNIYVSNLGFNVQDEDLKEFFTPYGEVSSAKIINDRESGRSRGFGFVEMPDDAAAQKAIQELNDASVEGRTIKVMEAKPKEDRPARSGGGGGGGGYRDNNSGGGGGGYNKKKW
ncbi:MAG: RNA-binding protein [Flavisolibacter sp.]|jgi:RNA recognition motif-containing protein|nr:RNA-binding protein [Flavisolibacter sp.]